MRIVLSRSGPFLAWLAIQLLTLSIGAMRLPLTARSGTEPQHLAFAEMIIVQMALATMLCPILLREEMGMIVALSTLPFLQLAGFLTAEQAWPQIITSLAIVIWICGLGLWMKAIQSMQNRLIAVAVLNCFVIGTPILRYLIEEFADSPTTSGGYHYLACNPIEMLLRQTGERAISVNPLATPILLMITGAIAIRIQRNNLFRAKLSPNLPTAHARKHV
jgi:hypothetical protein